MKGKRRNSSGKRLPRSLLWIGMFVLFALSLVASGAWMLSTYARRPALGRGGDVEFVLAPELAPWQLAQILADAGLVDQPDLFGLYFYSKRRGRPLPPGEHLLQEGLSPAALLARLERRPSVPRVSVTIPEGWTRFAIAKRFQDAHITSGRAFLQQSTNTAFLTELEIPGNSAEGYLFPNTYTFYLNTDARTVIRRMKSEFNKQYKALASQHASTFYEVQRTLKGERNLLILASMLEKEAALDAERPLIAGVLLNRLRSPTFRPKLLQSDVTAPYGCLLKELSIPSCLSYTGKVLPAMLLDASNPYNTYKHEGLPPGPIANPGAKSLEAVMNPAVTSSLFFVALGNGRHLFSKTYIQHKTAIRSLHSPPLSKGSAK